MRSYEKKKRKQNVKIRKKVQDFKECVDFFKLNFVLKKKHGEVKQWNDQLYETSLCQAKNDCVDNLILTLTPSVYVGEPSLCNVTVGAGSPLAMHVTLICPPSTASVTLSMSEMIGGTEMTKKKRSNKMN